LSDLVERFVDLMGSNLSQTSKYFMNVINTAEQRFLLICWYTTYVEYITLIVT